MKIRYTDRERYPTPYITAEQSKAEGYLAKRFKEIREAQEKNEQEQKLKVSQMRRK